MDQKPREVLEKEVISLRNSCRGYSQELNQALGENRKLRTQLKRAETIIDALVKAAE